jgi:hypothetical protein
MIWRMLRFRQVVRPFVNCLQVGHRLEDQQAEEIVKLLREFSATELELVAVLTKPFCPFQVREPQTSMAADLARVHLKKSGLVLVMRGMILKRRSATLLKSVRSGSAQADIQMAIVSMAKHFLSTPLVQHLITLIHSGQIVYLPHSTRSLITDTYRSEATQARLRRSSNVERGHYHEPEAPGGVYSYDPFEAGWLDHGRLRVPRWRNWLQFQSFAVLLALFIWVLSGANSKAGSHSDQQLATQTKSQLPRLHSSSTRLDSRLTSSRPLRSTAGKVSDSKDVVCLRESVYSANVSSAPCWSNI